MPWLGGRRKKEAGDGGGVQAATTTRSERADQLADDADASIELESHHAVPSVDGPLDASVRVIDTNPAHTNRKRGRLRGKKSRKKFFFSTLILNSHFSTSRKKTSTFHSKPRHSALRDPGQPLAPVLDAARPPAGAHDARGDGEHHLHLR